MCSSDLSWEDYVKGLENIDTDTAVALLQKYVDVARTMETTEE